MAKGTESGTHEGQQQAQGQQQSGQSQPQQGQQQQWQGQGQQQMGSQQGGSVTPARQGELQRYGRHPLALMERMMRDMDEMVESFFGTPMSRRAVPRFTNVWIPEAEMREEGNQLKVCFDLPGLTKDNVKVDIQDGALVVQGERREERSEDGEQGMRRSERRYGSFYRALPLPENVEVDKAQAQMKDGVLEVTFPLGQQQRGRRLEIKG